MNDEIKEIREYISCPQFGDNHYGKWGALRLDQRRKIKDLLDYITNLQQDNKEKDKIIKIMENYLELIYDLGFDYDGCETTGDLCLLINELVRYASLGRVYNTKETIYVNGNKKYNILHEEIKNE